jgi:hypothetical protein
MRAEAAATLQGWRCGGMVQPQKCAECSTFPCDELQAALAGRQGMLAWLVLCLGE